MLGFNADVITYDNNGNMATVTNSCGLTKYTWDVRNRLVGINGYKPDCSILTASFIYDPLGRRIEKTINGRTIKYLYDGLDIVQEIENSLPTVNYVRTMNIDEPLAGIELSTNTTKYYHADALGSIVGLSSHGRTVGLTTSYTYDAFGQVTISGEMSDNPFQYTGRENDGTGLYYYRARYYSPELQRFVSEDPIGSRGGDVNYYAYVNNRPATHRDPLGLFLMGCSPADPFKTIPPCMQAMRANDSDEAFAKCNKCAQAMQGGFQFGSVGLAFQTCMTKWCNDHNKLGDPLCQAVLAGRSSK